MNRTLPIAALTALLGLPSASAAVLFSDNFDRADDRNIDASLTGIVDVTGSAFAGDDVYTQPWLDPNNAAPTYGVQDATPGNGGGARILSNTLQLAVGSGTSNAFINHNFTDTSLRGGFSVTIDIGSYGGTSNDFGGGFAIGMALSDALNAGDSWNATQKFQDGFPGAQNAVTDVSIASFWMLLRGDNTVIWGTSGNALSDGPVDTGRLGLANVSAKTGTLTAVFSAFTDFNAGTEVGFEVFYDGNSLGTGSFNWASTDANYIGLDARDGTSVTFDNFAIETVPEPSALGLAGLSASMLLRRRR
ncbi:hypothetical protein HNR46_002083 [Haloferula luteola]|uniref:PEP-CTERM protein-sorting domain-containing protein n=1 Tax=Haloferula luteola TaxID=595692 RepID=A0A840V8C4_9BACT|nr:hypothetical protein [Haloferula luteola]MBB5351844.1 hypothetical protein [Haloferula luteola]